MTSKVAGGNRRYRAFVAQNRRQVTISCFQITRMSSYNCFDNVSKECSQFSHSLTFALNQMNRLLLKSR